MNSGWYKPVSVDLVELAVLEHMKPKVLLVPDLIRVLTMVKYCRIFRLKSQYGLDAHISTNCLFKRHVVSYVFVLFKPLANLSHDLMI
jgi:hypothetical protein